MRLLLTLLLASPLVAQLFPFPGPGSVGVIVPSTYTFVTYTYVPETMTAATSVTSPALTLSAADLVAVYCRVAGTSPPITFSSNNGANTWVSLTQINASSFAGTLGYILSAAAGSTTFTCSFPSGGYYSMIVLQYHHTGIAAAFDTQIGNTVLAQATVTSGSFNTTGTPGLVVMCSSVAATGVWTAGAIAGSPATLRGVSASALTGTADSACEDSILSTPQTGITASLNKPTAVGVYTVGVWK